MSQCDSYITAGHMVGLAFNAQASLISFMSVAGFIAIILIRYRRNCRKPPGGPWRLLRTNLDAWMLNLLAAEFIMSIGGMIDVKWVVEKHVYCGQVCSAEAALSLIGFTGSALFTSAVAVQTWLSVYSLKARTSSYSLPIWLGVSAAVWTFLLLFTALGPSPFWCSINSEYRAARISGQYIWVWLCAFGNITLYVPLYLFSRGNLEFLETNSGVQWKWRFPARPLPGASSPDNSSQDPLDSDTQEQQELRSQAWKMLLYPLAYTIQVLGLSITRWIRFIAQPNGVSLVDDPTLGGYAAAQLFFSFVSRLGGFINVLLIITTRPNILLFGSRGVLGPNDPRARGKAEGPQNVEAEVTEQLEANLPRPSWFELGGLNQMRNNGRA